MKKITLLGVLLWVLSAPLAAQNAPPEITVEAILIEFALNGDLKTVQKLVTAGVPVDSTGDKRP